MQLAKILAALSASLLAHVALHSDVVSAHGVASERYAHDSAARALSARASLNKCKNADHARALENRLTHRRLAKVTELRAQLQQQRQLRRLDAAEIAAKSHRGNASQIEDPQTIFGATPKCVLQPETTQGPYYVKGELVRSDLRETQRGVDLHTEIQVIDTATCEPVDNLFLDFWHCNATGVYSGVVAQGNGDVNDRANLNATFGRGVSATNADGVASFTTKFPGHYAGRATHIHIVGSVNGTVLPNSTYVGARAVHVGQLFFDMDLVEAVEATEPYASNDAVITKNCVDKIFQQSTAGEFDPVVNYVYLGETVEDGIFSWITVGVDTSVGLPEVGAAATLTASGGVASSADTPRTRPEDGHDHGYGRGDSGVPNAPGPKIDGDDGAARNTTTETRLSEEDEPKARSGAFSFLFFVASASTLATILYKFPTKKEPRKMYAPMNSA